MGLSSRTNHDGFAQIKHIFEQLGARVVQIPVSGTLHLKSIITALSDNSILYHRESFPPETESALKDLHLTLQEVPELYGVNVVDLTDNKILVKKQAPETIKLLKTLGYEVIPIDVSEFAKLDGCLTCLSVRIREIQRDSPFFDVYDDEEAKKSDHGSNVEYQHSDEENEESKAEPVHQS